MKTPVFLTVPEALNWAKKHDWGALLLADTDRDAQKFICQTRQMSVPLWLVEVRATYDSPIPWLADQVWSKGMGILIEKHDLATSWDPGKWQIGFDCWVGGERRNDYGDRRWRLLKT